MSQHPYTVVQAAPARSADDRATWALIAILVLLVAGGAGWLIARESAPTWDDAEQYARIAQGEASLQGRDRGWSEGAKAGRREARMRADLEALKQRPAAWSEGWNRGFQSGRERAQARRGGLDPYLGGGYDAFPPETYGDVEGSLSDLFTDPPGYATSSLSGLGADGTPSYGSSSSSLEDLYRGR